MGSMRLKDLRIKKGLSQQVLADNLFISQSTINNYENEVSQPSIEMLIKFADFFDVSIDYLVGYSDLPRKVEPVSSYELNENEKRHLDYYRCFPIEIRKKIDTLMSLILTAGTNDILKLPKD